MLKFSKFFTFAILILTAACARNIDPNVYKASHIGETSTTYMATIVNVRQVMVEDKEYLEQNGMGLIGGGGLGALAGSQFGKGRGEVVGGILGGIAGAVAGTYAEKELKSQMALEYVVKLDDGRLKTLVQGQNPTYRVGERVYLAMSHGGRSRIIGSAAGANVPSAGY